MVITIGILLGHLMDYFKRAEAKGVPLELTVNNGVDYSVCMAAAMPGSAAPIEMDELGIASQLRGKPVELIESQTVAVEGIANAQFIFFSESTVCRIMKASGAAAFITTLVISVLSFVINDGRQ